MISYLIWNGSPEIFAFGSFALRWYGLLFALGFLISQQILFYMFKKEGKPERDVEILTVYMVVATIIGARLGHILFYEPQTIWTDPLSIFLPFEFSPQFRFTGLQGLASHGAAIAILFALWLYARKKKPGQNFLQIVDRIVIVVALTGALIRTGNFFNSEIIGKPTDSPLGVVFVNRITEAIKQNKSGVNPVDFVQVKKDASRKALNNGRVPISIYIFFNPGTQQIRIHDFLNYEVKSYLATLDEFVDQPRSEELKYELVQEQSGSFGVKIFTMGVSRHPAQLYEAFSCIALFVLLFLIWNKYKENLPAGRTFGYFMVILWSLRFAYEFLKEPQVQFENDLVFNMGQNLSIPMFLAGILILIRSYRPQPDKSMDIPNS
jgi:phosphatidylglycerol:prolipoprotein diacylglycerol transferase